MELDLTERGCAIGGCPKRRHSLGYCIAHYRRLKRNGSPTAGRKTPTRIGSPMPHGTPLPDAFWSKVGRAGICWEWRGSKSKYGHGQFQYTTAPNVRVRVGAHRFSWELANGPVPDGLWVLHHCDNPPCVRPDHLFLGTHKDNMADMKAKGRGRKKTGVRG
jgi:hypothetical protein